MKNCTCVSYMLHNFYFQFPVSKGASELSSQVLFLRTLSCFGFSHRHCLQRRMFEGVPAACSPATPSGPAGLTRALGRNNNSPDLVARPPYQQRLGLLMALNKVTAGVMNCVTDEVKFGQVTLSRKGRSVHPNTAVWAKQA